jgi:DNA-binding NarL/FixJ family response regulator
MNPTHKGNEKIQVMLVEDHHVLRGGLKMLIDAQPDMVVVAEAGDGVSALSLLHNGLHADILLSDLNMPNMDGFTLFENLQELDDAPKPIAFSMLNSEKHVEKAMQLGCLGYLTKSIESDELLFGIRQVYSGKKYLCSDIVDAITVNLKKTTPGSVTISLPDFSERELEVLELIAKGMSNLQIANEIFLSKRTVEGHRQSLLDKTGSKNTAVLIKYAVINGLLR